MTYLPRVAFEGAANIGDTSVEIDTGRLGASGNRLAGGEEELATSKADIAAGLQAI